jgi:hypothetical protein
VRRNLFGASGAEKLCARLARPALWRGPSTSPLDNAHDALASLLVHRPDSSAGGHISALLRVGTLARCTAASGRFPHRGRHDA